METKKSEIKLMVKTKSLLDSLLKKRIAKRVKTKIKIKLVISLLKIVINPKVKSKASTTKKKLNLVIRTSHIKVYRLHSIKF
ncbi:hypothetical protein HMPREF3219_0201980 [Streptococcus salivarius]|nr:hypothetical protein HMPREF3219_0201980 [Streptococcus salivarius]